MTRSATGSWNYAEDLRRTTPITVALGALCLASVPARAQEVVTDRKVTVGDVMLTPLNDLNISKDAIPPILVQAHAAPYDDVGLTDCIYVEQEIGNLDAVLGEDFDTARRPPRAESPEGMAQSVLASFIPFRSVIRHFSGANRHAAEFREAITAGLARRAYLKGLGQGMGCAYPSRPAPPGLLVRPEGMGSETETQTAAPDEG